MCTFYNTLPKQSKSVGIKKRRLGLFLKPCADEKTYYRFRLLAFNSPNTDRDFPWIQRFLHVKFGVDPEKGYPVVVDQITCPVTPHVHVEGNRYNACKMCDVANKYFVAFKESGYQDKEAGKKNKEFGRKLEYAIPVYVVNDPNYENNNGKFKVMILNDKKVYEELKAKVERQTIKNNVFNGVNAVDCCVNVTEVPEVKNEGQPNEYVWKRKEYKFVFSNKPYDLPAITKEAVDNMGFDDEYYTTSTPEEINAFYKKWCTVSNDDIPEEDTDVPVYTAPVKTAPAKAAPVQVQNTAKSEEFDDPLKNDLDDLIDDIETPAAAPSPVEAPVTPAPSAPAEQPSTDASTKEIDDLLDGLDL